MTLSVNQLCQRLITEQGWLLLTDCDQEPSLPEEEHFWQRIRNSNDPVEQEQLYFELQDETAKLVNALPLIGGPFPEMKALTEIDGISLVVVISSPALRQLKPYCSRVLVKRQPLAIRVAVIIEEHLPAGLTRDVLSGIGAQAREEFLGELEEDVPADESRSERKARKKREQTLKRLPLIFELIVVGQRIQTDNRRRALCKLRQRRTRGPFVGVHGYLLDSASGAVWSTNRLTGWHSRSYYRYALKHGTESVSEIREKILNSRPGILFVLASIATALLTNFGFKLLVNGQGDLSAKLWFLGDIIVPVVVITIACNMMRLNLHVATQARRFLIGYLAVYSTLFLGLAWVPTFQHCIYLVTVGFVVTITTMMGAYIKELE